MVCKKSGIAADGVLGNLGHEMSWGCQTPRKSLVADDLDVTRCWVNEIKNLSRYRACVEARFWRRRNDNLR